MAREQLFVASKVAAEHKTYEEAMAGIDKTLETMGLDYLDLMIIHSPQLSFPEAFQDILSDWLMIFPVVQRRL